MSARPARDLELWLVFAALAFVWGSSYLFIKLGLEGGLRPLTLVTLRLWLAVAFLVVLARLTGARLPDSVKRLRDPVPVEVTPSPELERMTRDLDARLALGRGRDERSPDG